MNTESDFNQELFQQYIQESDTNLLRIMVDFRELKKQPKNQKLLSSIFRGFHNLKAGAFAFQLPNMRRIAHLVEDILALLRDDKILLDNNLIDLIDESVDSLDEILIHLYELGWEGRKSYIQLILKLKSSVDKYHQQLGI